MRIIRDIPYCDIGHPAQKLDIYLPECEEFSVFIYFHGGGIEKGSKSNGKSGWAKELMASGISVFGVQGTGRIHRCTLHRPVHPEKDGVRPPDLRGWR